MEKLFKADFEVLKVEEKLGIVLGWGMVTKLADDDGAYFDLDNQTFPDHEMLKATTLFMKGERINNDSHTPKNVGNVIHSFPLTPEIAKAMGITSKIYGWMVGVAPDEESLEKFASGEYTGFSIEGGVEQFVDIDKEE